MSGKQHKRELKRQKQQQREAARRLERRRTLITLAVIALVVAVGAGVGAYSVTEERRVALEQQREAEELASEARARASEQAERLADREVACNAQVPDGAGARKPTFDEPEDVLEEGVDYRAVVETSCGTVTVDLAERAAPQTVNSFVFLARQGFFDGLEIFRNATTIGALQTGSGTNDAAFQIGYTIPDELRLARNRGYPPGTVAMANAGPDTAGSQFFFVYNRRFQRSFRDNAAYARFGRVTEGIDVLRELGDIAVMDPDAQPPDPMAEMPSEIAYIEAVRIETSERSAGE